jgi:hypothetical protein
MRLVLLLLLAAVTAASQSAPLPSTLAKPNEPPSALFDDVDDMLASLSKITGWKVRHKVPSETLSREKFSKMVDEDATESEKDKSTRAAELTMKMFGLVPWDFNLARESANLIEEQAAAFYDFHKKRLFVLEGSTEAASDPTERRVALAHELAHALADQQFDLNHYINGAKDDDAATARQSVVEGQASWLSWAYLAEYVGGNAEVPEAVLNDLANVGATGDEFPVLTQTPLYMRESLTFPYTEGMKFQDAIYRKLGKAAFTQVFKDAPLSTQEILHPEDYDDKIVPAHPKLPKDPIGKDSKDLRKLTDGDVGEFDYSAILRQYLSQTEGRQAASHWRGGTYALYEYKKTKMPLLVHVSDWDSPMAARDFMRLYLDVLRAKWKRIEIRQQTDTEVTGTGDRGDFSLRLEGASVLCMEGVAAK